jgi:hypothetical protein
MVVLRFLVIGAQRRAKLLPVADRLLQLAAEALF